MNNLVLRALNQRPIAYYPIYKDITGSTTAGILLSQLMYWFSKKDEFYKTDADLIAETKLSSNELRTAKNKIKKLDFIAIKLKGVPAKTNYKIDWERYENALEKFAKSSLTDNFIEEISNKNNETVIVKSTKPVSLNSLNCDSEIHETNTKTTTKTTTKTKINNKKAPKTKNKKQKTEGFYQPTIDDLDDNNPPKEISTSMLGLKIDQFFRKLLLGNNSNLARLKSKINIELAYSKFGEKRITELMSLAEIHKDRWQGTEYKDSSLLRLVDALSGNLDLTPKPVKKEIEMLEPNTKIIANEEIYTVREMSKNGIVFVYEDYELIFMPNEYERLEK